jgi:hypothetical protein
MERGKRGIDIGRPMHARQVIAALLPFVALAPA